MPLDLSNDKSIFLQIAQMIENDILRDILKADEQCLSTNELARLYNINPNTAAKGLSVLMTNEILYKKRGVGMFISPGAKEKILKSRKETFIKDYVAPLIHEAKSIGMTKDDLIKIITEEN